jgi:quercetin dioxygenase-like cupin family protein
VIAARWEDVELSEMWSENDPSCRSRQGYALAWGDGPQASAVVLFELEPGMHLGSHLHSAEEAVLVYEGEVEVRAQGESRRLGSGGMAVVPARTPHDVRGAGQATARCVGFFAAASVETVFEEPLQPSGERVQGTPTPKVD